MANRFFPNYPSYIIPSPFGMRTHPVTGVKNKMHNGIDLVATKDGKTGQVDDIMAHTAGTVYAVGYDASAGNFIKIKVADGAIMVYYHLKDKPALKKGQAVKQGQIIGRMGATGNVTGAHLHWGIQKGGKWIDPEPYLDADYIKPAKTITLELPVLKRGAKGNTVKALQALLNLRMASVDGWTPLDLDGSFGGKTESAVKKYQADHKLDVDGSAGRATWSSLIGG